MDTLPAHATATENVPAKAPVVTDTLPAGVSLVDATASPGTVACSTSGQDLTCDLPNDLGAGEKVTIELTVALAPDVEAGRVVNTATVSTQTRETTLANNTGQAASTVVVDADLAVAGFEIEPVDAGSTGPGSQRYVDFDLRNNGPSTATDVTFRVERTVDGFVDLGGLAFPASQCNSTAQELACAVAGSLPPGESIHVRYVLQVAPYAQPGTYPSTVHVSGSTPDSVLANNTGHADVVVTSAVTALQVTKVPAGTIPNPYEPDGPHNSFVAGGPFSYRFEVQVPAPGTGFSDAGHVVITDVLPAGFTAEGAGSSQGECTITPAADPASTGDTVRCDLGTVPGWSGATAPPPVTITVHGRLDPDANDLHGGGRFAEQVENTAVVTTDTPLDSGADSVSATAVVDIVEVADLQLVKTPDQAGLIAG